MRLELPDLTGADRNDAEAVVDEIVAWLNREPHFLLRYERIRLLGPKPRPRKEVRESERLRLIEEVRALNRQLAAAKR